MMRGIRRGAIFVAALTLMVGAAACGSSDKDGSSDGSSSKGDPIVLGAVLSKGGFMAQWDDKSFIQFAVDDINRKGGVNGRPLKLITCDQQSRVNLGATCAKEVLAKGADIVITADDFGFGSPAALVAQAAGKLSMSLGAQSTRYTPKALGNLAFTAGTASNQHGALMAEYAMKRGWKTAYLIWDTVVAYHEEVCNKYFSARYKQLGGTIVGRDSFADNDPSIPSQITRIKNAKPEPDVIVLCSVAPGGPAAVRQLRAAGIDQPILADPAGSGEQYPKATPGLSDYYWLDFVSPFGNDKSTRVNDLTDRYKQANGEAPPNTAIYGGYDLVYLLHDAIKAAGGSLDGNKLAAELAKFKDHPTPVFGPSSYSEDEHWRTSSMALLRWVNGKPQLVGRASAQSVPAP